MSSRPDEAQAALKQRLTQGVDANRDGIRDDVAALLQIEHAPTREKTVESRVGVEIDRALADSAPPRAQPPRRGCLDYLLQEPKHRAAADRYVQAHTPGAFGSHPCDPFVSPMLERPFDTDFAELPLGPVKLHYAKHE
jgi:hypothetical protein